MAPQRVSQQLLVFALFALGCDTRIGVLDQGRDASLDPTGLDAGMDGAEMDGGTDGGSDAGADGGTPEEVEAYTQAEAYCGFIARCSPAVFRVLFYGGAEHCIRTRAGWYLDVVGRGGGLADPEACLAAMRTGCPFVWPASCEPGPGPLVEGATCDDDFECGLDGRGRRMRCRGGCGGTCVPLFDLGAACEYREYDCDLDAGQSCQPVGDGPAASCVMDTVVGEGQPCTGSRRCAEGFTCSSAAGVCFRRALAGEICEGSAPFACLGSWDLVCVPDGTGVERCVDRPPPLPPGASCVVGDYCTGNFICVDGTCPTSCLDGLECPQPFEACDPDTGRCEYQPTCR